MRQCVSAILCALALATAGCRMNGNREFHLSLDGATITVPELVRRVRAASADAAVTGDTTMDGNTSPVEGDELTDSEVKIEVVQYGSVIINVWSRDVAQQDGRKGGADVNPDFDVPVVP